MAREISGQVAAAIFVPVSSGSFQVPKLFKQANPEMPVVAIDRDAPSNLIDLFIAFGSKEAAAQVANKALEIYRSKGKQSAKALVITGDLTSVAGQDRRDGMLEVLKANPEIEVMAVLEARKWLPADVQQKIEATLNAFGRPDIVVSGFEGGAQAAVNALERKGWIKPLADEQHVVIGSIDTGSSVLDGIRTEKIDFTVDQPNLFYLPIAINYALSLLEKGKSVLPQIGQTLTDKDLPIYQLAESSPHKLIWSNPFWSPATVEFADATKHLQVKMQGLFVDKSNVDAPYLYPNVVGVGK